MQFFLYFFSPIFIINPVFYNERIQREEFKSNARKDSLADDRRTNYSIKRSDPNRNKKINIYN